MTCIVKNIIKYPTKKALREAVAAGEIVSFEDPSIFNPRWFTTYTMAKGTTEVVTNHPKRSWFAQVTKDLNGKVVVK